MQFRGLPPEKTQIPPLQSYQLGIYFPVLSHFCAMDITQNRFRSDYLVLRSKLIFGCSLILLNICLTGILASRELSGTYFYIALVFGLLLLRR